MLRLWDIDGTLIASGGAGMLALQRGLRDGLGLDGSLDDIEFAGRTDRWIARTLGPTVDDSLARGGNRPART